jgi:hypothetical protein
MALNAVAEIRRQGKGLMCFEGAFAANGLLAIPTGLATIDSVAVTIKKAAATAPETVATTWAFAGGTVTIKGWKVTAVDDNTLIASDAEETASVTIYGRRRT